MDTVSSGYIPVNNEPNPDEIIEALREAIFKDPRLTEMPAEEVARKLVLGGLFRRSPHPYWWLTCWMRLRLRRATPRNHETH